MILALEVWIGERNAREKLVLAAGAVLAVLLIVWGLLIEPPWRAIQKLQHDLPQMRTQLALMQSQAHEVQRLGSEASRASPGGEALRSDLSASLALHGLGSARIDLLGVGVRIDGHGLRFATVIAWLDEIRRTERVRVGQAHVKARADGLVDVDVTLLPSGDR
jgi:general secretion pathway protein M